MKKLAVISIIIIVAGIISWQVFLKVSSSSKDLRRSANTVPVAVTPIQKITIRDIGRFTGTLHPRSQFVVAPKIAGRIEKLWLDIGDPVESGQLIAVLDDDEYLQQVDQTQAELEVARAVLEEKQSDLEIEKREFNRIAALREKKTVSVSELDIAEAQYRSKLAQRKVAQSQLVEKEAVLKTAQVRLSYSRIRAPKNQDQAQWVVAERYVDEGTMLAPNTPILSIIDMSAMKAVIQVIERDYSRVHIDQPAKITTDAYSDRMFSGKIARIAPLLNETSREARVEIAVPNPDGRLKPGMFVRVKLEFGRNDNAAVVPLAALVRREGRQGVFVADMAEKKARFVPITVGIVEDTLAEVVSPTLSGSVITLGHHLLEDGSTIRLSESNLPQVRPEKSDKTRLPMAKPLNSGAKP
jgi:RND family efflux transporter MFP subunit